MSNLKISQLTTLTSLDATGNEEFVLAEGTNNKKINLTNVEKYITNHLEPLALSITPGPIIDLNDSAYDTVELLLLRWTGPVGTQLMDLPDATDPKNLNRVKRIITDSSFTTSTRVELQPKAGQTLDGGTGAYTINKSYEGITVWCDGVEWYIIQSKA